MIQSLLYMFLCRCVGVWGKRKYNSPSDVSLFSLNLEAGKLHLGNPPLFIHWTEADRHCVSRLMTWKLGGEGMGIV